MATKSITKKEAEEHGVSKSLANILGDGAKEALAGAGAGTGYAGFPYGTASGAIIGLGSGLVMGAGLEASVINNMIENQMEEFKNGAVNLYYYLKGEGGYYGIHK